MITLFLFFSFNAAVCTGAHYSRLPSFVEDGICSRWILEAKLSLQVVMHRLKLEWMECFITKQRNLK